MSGKCSASKNETQVNIISSSMPLNEQNENIPKNSSVNRQEKKLKPQNNELQDTSSITIQFKTFMEGIKRKEISNNSGIQQKQNVTNLTHISEVNFKSNVCNGTLSLQSNKNNNTANSKILIKPENKEILIIKTYIKSKQDKMPFVQNSEYNEKTIFPSINKNNRVKYQNNLLQPGKYIPVYSAEIVRRNVSKCLLHYRYQVMKNKSNKDKVIRSPWDDLNAEKFKLIAYKPKRKVHIVDSKHYVRKKLVLSLPYKKRSLENNLIIKKSKNYAFERYDYVSTKTTNKINLVKENSPEDEIKSTIAAKSKEEIPNKKLKLTASNQNTTTNISQKSISRDETKSSSAKPKVKTTKERSSNQNTTIDASYKLLLPRNKTKTTANKSKDEAPKKRLKFTTSNRNTTNTSYKLIETKPKEDTNNERLRSSSKRNTTDVSSKVKLPRLGIETKSIATKSKENRTNKRLRSSLNQNTTCDEWNKLKISLPRDKTKSTAAKSNKKATTKRLKFSSSNENYKRKLYFSDVKSTIGGKTKEDTVNKKMRFSSTNQNRKADAKISDQLKKKTTRAKLRLSLSKRNTTDGSYKQKSPLSKVKIESILTKSTETANTDKKSKIRLRSTSYKLKFPVSEKKSTINTASKEKPTNKSFFLSKQNGTINSSYKHKLSLPGENEKVAKSKEVTSTEKKYKKRSIQDTTLDASHKLKLPLQGGKVKSTIDVKSKKEVSNKLRNKSTITTKTKETTYKRNSNKRLKFSALNKGDASYKLKLRSSRSKLVAQIDTTLNISVKKKENVRPKRIASKQKFEIPEVPIINNKTRHSMKNTKKIVTSKAKGNIGKSTNTKGILDEKSGQQKANSSILQITNLEDKKQLSTFVPIPKPNSEAILKDNVQKKTSLEKKSEIETEKNKSTNETPETSPVPEDQFISARYDQNLTENFNLNSNCVVSEMLVEKYNINFAKSKIVSLPNLSINSFEQISNFRFLTRDLNTLSFVNEMDSLNLRNREAIKSYTASKNTNEETKIIEINNTPKDLELQISPSLTQHQKASAVDEWTKVIQNKQNIQESFEDKINSLCLFLKNTHITKDNEKIQNKPKQKKTIIMKPKLLFFDLNKKNIIYYRIHAKYTSTNTILSQNNNNEILQKANASNERNMECSTSKYNNKEENIPISEPVEKEKMEVPKKNTYGEDFLDMNVIPTNKSIIGKSNKNQSQKQGVTGNEPWYQNSETSFDTNVPFDIFDSV